MAGQIMQARRMKTDITVTSEERARLAKPDRGSQHACEGNLAGAHRFAQRRRRDSQGDLPGDGQVQAVCMALAEAVR